MGCGGSRTDVLEPRYPETWTRDTESTWLSATDADVPVSSVQTLCVGGVEGVEASEPGVTSQTAARPGEDKGQLLSRHERPGTPGRAIRSTRDALSL